MRLPVPITRSAMAVIPADLETLATLAWMFDRPDIARTADAMRQGDDPRGRKANHTRPG